ncbi:crustacyanin-A1 subunit [Procambarus clarkii]|uniref:crustacyanin-A1 subunit n=1 Tax=Procambarus clarkii TaxID=6728 RepID=UPI003743DE7F
MTDKLLNATIKTSKMKYVVYPCLLAWLSVGTQAASCPILKLKQQFSIDKYMGVWYEIQAQPSIFQTIKSCLSSTYTWDGKDVQVYSEGLDSKGAPVLTKSTLKIVDPQNPAHMITNFVPGVQPPFDIVDTDYLTFSCAHSCLSVVGIKTEFVFVYARNRSLSQDIIQHCRAIFKSYDIDVSTLVSTPQDGCHEHTDL